MHRTRLSVQNSPEQLALMGWFHREDKSGLYVAKPLEFEKVSDDAYIYRETFIIGRHERDDFCQCLLDDLYRIGYRPKDATRGDKTDIKAHLEDMRKIAFGKLRMETPKE